MVEGRLRPAWAEIDLDAVAHNVGILRRLVAPAQVCAVVKADAYGHGAVTVAGAALEAGAAWLAVALPEEGIELRRAGIQAPVLVLSEPVPGAMAEAVGAGLTLTVYRPEGVAAAAVAAHAEGRSPLAVHLK
ncbi:MAG: alanine racemase, partial [Acidimicrobiales bacterium]